MPTTCFLIARTPALFRALRRYSDYKIDPPCPLSGAAHEAMAQVEDGAEGDDDQAAPATFLADPRWPSACACGYLFTEQDTRQVFTLHWYTRLDGQPGRYTTHYNANLHPAPPGAMWDAPWHVDRGDEYTGPDGRCLMVRLPDHTDWVMDGPASNGPGWKREGEPPLLTVTPSIKSRAYHGWLTNGILSDNQ